MAKEFLPLVLSVKAAGWRMNDDGSAEADAEFQHVRTSVLERDSRTCRFCGFRANKYQEVHHLNDDHRDNRKENLVTACMYCHMVQHIALAGKQKEATLAWIPEIDQASLHHIVRTIQVLTHWADGLSKDKSQPLAAARTAKDMSNAARSLETRLRSREAKAQELFGTCDPHQFGDMLHAAALDVSASRFYDERAIRLQGLRLLPLGIRVQGGKNIMPGIVDEWLKTGPYASLPPRSWQGILKKTITDF